MNADPLKTIEQAVGVLESTANFLRGMSLDPSLPTHIRAAVLSRTEQIDAVVEKTSF